MAASKMGHLCDVFGVLIIAEVVRISGVLGDGGEVCRNRMDTFYCDTGCCGDYKEERCCSIAGMIVGIIIGVVLLIGITAALVFCYCKKRARDNRRTGSVYPFGGRNRPRNGPRGTITVLTSAGGYTSGTQPMYPGFTVYSPSSQQNSNKIPLPPSYDEIALGAPPPYSAVNHRPSSHGIGSTVETGPRGAAPVS